MDVKIFPQALKVIDSIASFVESKNTEGSGASYTLRSKAAIEKLALPNVQYTLCKHPIFSASGYSCSHFNDWVIAFKVKDDLLTVYK